MSRSSLFIIAHRGASAVAPESTRVALHEAQRAGANMVELDIQLTRDQRLVVFHDERVERTTDGVGRVSHMRYVQLASLDAGSWFHPRFASERILLLSQALRMIPARMRINLELKRTPRRATLLARLRTCLHRTRVAPRLLISSFDPRLLHPLRTDGFALALICRLDAERSLRDAIRLGCTAWHPFAALVTPRRVARAHAAGLRVHAWTVDEVRCARALMRYGVDGLFTNDPGRLRRALGSRVR